jgi:hypothetical protein
MNEVQNLLNDAANFDSFEAFENYVASTRPDLYNKVMSQAGSMRKMSLAPRRGTNVPALGRVEIGGSKNTPSAAATFTFKVKRVSDNINHVLPLPIFGYLGQNNSFADFVNPLMPTNVSLAVTYQANGDIYFTYTNTVDGDSDNIIVTCNEIAYRTFLEATGITKMVVNKVRYDISDVTKLSQFSNNFLIAAKDLMGKYSSENVTPSTFKSPEQYQSGIVDLDIKAQIKPETCFVLGMGTNGANFTVTLTNFVSILDKVV